ncbi:MAG: MerR family transcriptional regulator [Dorea sp.]|nr:MerR family transcriptional regulator [Dorea sp.]
MTISDVSKKYGISQDTLRYYEKIGVIPPVNRNESGLRDYTEEDCGWVELAACMRSAGLPLDALTEYVRLSREGDTTIPERRQLLLEQKERLMIQLKAIQETLERLDYKISRYDKAMETGRLVWD